MKLQAIKMLRLSSAMPAIGAICSARNTFKAWWQLHSHDRHDSSTHRVSAKPSSVKSIFNMYLIMMAIDHADLLAHNQIHAD